MFCDCQRFELKKISDLTEDDLREDNTDEVVAGADEDQLEEAENALQSDDKEQHTGTPRTITASKILKANLACQCLLSIVYCIFHVVFHFLKIFLAKRAITLQLHFAECFSTVKNIELTIFKPI